MTSTRGIVGLALVLVAIVGFVLVAQSGWQVLDTPELLYQEILSQLDSPARPGDQTPRLFVVREGETASRISERLASEGFIDRALVFRAMAEMRGVAADLEAGEYELAPGMRPSEILAILVAGRTRPAPMVTIPEGWRAEEVAERLDARGIGPAGQFIDLVRRGRSDIPILASRPAGVGLEGYLFPDSYSFDERTTPESILRRMVEQFDARFSSEMREKAAAMGMTVHQVVTLASIIEREAVVPSERPLMAGVFYNRLREGVPLQSDPTVQYAVATENAESRQRHGWWKRELSREDLQVDSPYNTYRYPGLPPGPICSPGLASLLAALNPTSTDYIYFVARPDGSHAFARTLAEHNDNVARYR